MNIEAKEFTLDMSWSELWTTAFSVRSSLEETFKRHWINHQNAWKEHEKDKLLLLKTFFYALGRPDLYEDIFPMAEKIFAEFNEKRGSKKK